MVERLAAYEDSDLMPEQVEAAKNIIQLAFADDTTAVERLRALYFADKDGRALILPRKVGETVYYLNGKYIIEVEVIGYKTDEKAHGSSSGRHITRRLTGPTIAIWRRRESGRRYFSHARKPRERWRNGSMSKPKKPGAPAAYTLNARADFLCRPKVAKRRKWAVASDEHLERMVQKQMEHEKEGAGNGGF